MISIASARRDESNWPCGSSSLCSAFPESHVADLERMKTGKFEAKVGKPLRLRELSGVSYWIDLPLGSSSMRVSEDAQLLCQLWWWAVRTDCPECWLLSAWVLECLETWEPGEPGSL